MIGWLRNDLRQSSVSVSLLVAAAAVFSVGGVAQAQVTGSPGLDPGTSVSLILERGRFLSALPFDVQFFLVGDAADDLVTAQGRFARLTKTIRTCAAALPPPQPGQPVAGRAIEPVKPFNNGQRLVFELSVDPLEPNQDYCFEFEMSYRIKEEELRAATAEGLDLALQSVFGY